jgi:hypothetical protein
MHPQGPAVPSSFEWLHGRPLLRLGTLRDFESAVAQVSAALQRAVECGYGELLVCAREVAFAAPSLAARHGMVRRFAEAAGGRVRLVMMVRPELMDPERFGVVAAANFGLSGWVCCEEQEALAWFAEGVPF